MLTLQKDKSNLNLFVFASYSFHKIDIQLKTITTITKNILISQQVF